MLPAKYDPFRQSMAKTLIDSCPAVLKHELDNGRASPTRKMSNGTVVHQIVFGCRQFQEIDAPDYRTKAARESKEAILARGWTPVLSPDLKPLESQANRIKEYLRLELGIEPKARAEELKLTWEHMAQLGADQGPAYPLRCEGTPDHVSWDERGDAVIVDLKVGELASPEDWETKVETMCYDVQSAAYVEAVRANYGESKGGQTRYLIVATDPDLEMINHYELGEAFLLGGSRRWRKACRTYATCLATGTWPGYENRTLSPRPRYLAENVMQVRGYE